MKQPKIVYLYIGLRSYRIKLFNLLAQNFQVDFFWTENPKRELHVREENERILKEVSFPCTQAKEIDGLSFDGFSFKLFSLAFKKYDIYIFTSSVSFPFLALAPIVKLFGKKVLLFDELWRYPKEVLKYKIIHKYVKFILNNAVDSVIVSGSKAKEFYLESYSYKEENIFTAYNTTVDLQVQEENMELEKKVKSLLDKATPKKKILYLARIVEIKGLDILIKAMKKVSLEYDLVVVGDGDFLKTCKELVMESNLTSRVHFLSECFSNESKYYYKHTDIYVLPTRKMLQKNAQVESWGFTVNEAMSMSKPIVATTAVGSAYDLVIDGYNGFIANESDVKDLANKINLVIGNNIDNILGKNSRDYLLKKSNYKANLKAYIDAINNCNI